MKSRPSIIVQLIHIEGPLKNEIQEFSESEISIGRDPSCLVRFPPDLDIVSRSHAKIQREGNRFRLVDHSSNGTFVNGKRVEETYLKAGDVLTIAPGGPKVSFLTLTTEDPSEIKGPSTPSPPKSPPAFPNQEQHPALSATSRQVPREVRETVRVSVAIQYGLTLRSFKEVPVSIGTNPNCDFVLDHPGILGNHGEIYFAENQYWIKDLTGQKLIMINGRPVTFEAPLSLNDELVLGPDGPTFRFLGQGRLVEVKPSSS